MLHAILEFRKDSLTVKNRQDSGVIHDRVLQVFSAAAYTSRALKLTHSLRRLGAEEMDFGSQPTRAEPFQSCPKPKAFPWNRTSHEWKRPGFVAFGLRWSFQRTLPGSINTSLKQKQKNL